MITLKKLAELSGLSIRTVSRILQGAPHVQQQKRDTVLKLAAEHHYVPNMAARNLRLQDKKYVGILFEHFELAAATKQLNILSRELTRRGYFPVIGSIVPGHEDECAAMIHNWSGTIKYVVTIFLGSEETERKLREAVRNLPVTMIFADCAEAKGKFDLFVDRTGGICEMIRHLRESGFRKILYCGNTKSRLQAYAAAKKENKNRMEFLKINSEGNFEDGIRIGAEVMKSGAEAVFFNTDRMAAGFYRYAAEHGIRIPEDISVIGFDDDSFSEMLNPPLSTLAHPIQELAERICRIVVSGKRPEGPELRMKFLRRASIRSKEKTP